MSSRLIFPDDVRPDFEGFGKAAFAFLDGIAANNDRAWFTAHKKAYEAEVRFPLECLVAEFRPEGAGKGLPVRGDPSRAIFRIHRDVRFSKNKQPYKTHAGAILSRGGGRGEPGVVYIHIQPGNCFISAGFWRAEPVILTAWRRRMVEEPEEWLDLVRPYEDGKDLSYMRAISALKTMPRGFKQDADSPVAEYVKWKSFLLTRPVADAETMDRGLVDIIREHALKAVPLLEYGWALTDAPAEADPRRHMRAPGAKATR
jgi:uncharacterized protein (TIGR02453 family)